MSDEKRQPGAHTVSTGGLTVLLTGLPSAGKTTIARAVARELRAEKRRVEHLDGDELRRDLCADLGFSRTDRHENVRRVGTLALALAEGGAIVLISMIAPYAASRDEVRALHAQRNVPFVEVHVATPIDICARRDEKGLYARQKAGLLCGLTGVDDPYEPPTHPELVIATHTQTESDSIETLMRLLKCQLSCIKHYSFRDCRVGQE